MKTVKFLLNRTHPFSIVTSDVYQPYLLPTSNICERIFSNAGYCVNDRPKALSPERFERQIWIVEYADVNSLLDLNLLIIALINYCPIYLKGIAQSLIIVYDSHLLIFFSYFKCGNVIQ